MEYIPLEIEDCYNDLKKSLEIKNNGSSKDRVNEYFKLAHKLYLKVVKHYDFRYEIYIKWYNTIMKRMVKEDIIPDDLKHDSALILVEYVITDQAEVAKNFFDHNPLGEYTSLINLASKQYPKSEIDEDSEGRYAADSRATDSDISHKKVKADKKEIVDSKFNNTLMLAIMTDQEIEQLTDFTNRIRLFNDGELSTKEMKAFLNCKRAIRTRNNNQAALLFLLLANNSFIKNRWASIISGKELLIGSTGEPVKSAHSLTGAASRLYRKGYEAHNGEMRAIIDFVEMLAKRRKERT